MKIGEKSSLVDHFNTI